MPVKQLLDCLGNPCSLTFRASMRPHLHRHAVRVHCSELVQSLEIVIYDWLSEED